MIVPTSPGTLAQNPSRMFPLATLVKNAKFVLGFSNYVVQISSPISPLIQVMFILATSQGLHLIIASAFRPPES